MLSHWRIHINLAILVVPDVIVAQLVLIIKTWTGYKIWLGCSCLYVSSCKWAPENSNKGTIKTDKSQPLCLGARPCREQWAPALRTYFHLFSECPAHCGHSWVAPPSGAHPWSYVRLFPGPSNTRVRIRLMWHTGTGQRSSHCSQSVDVTGGVKTWRGAL